MEEQIKILIVDDDLVKLSFMKMILEASGFLVFEASDGEKCLQMVKLVKPDIVLLDVILPDIEGTEICSRIKSDPELEAIYVILVSEKKVSMKDQVGGIEGGADSYLPFPFARDELLAYIKSGVRIRKLFLGLNDEISKRKDIEDALRSSLKLLSMAEETASIGSWKLNIVTRRFQASDHFCRLFCLEPGFLEGKNEEIMINLLGRVHIDDKMAVKKFLEEILENSDLLSIEFRIICPDGGIRFMKSERLFSFSKSGNPSEVFGYIQDITQKHELEREKLRFIKLEEEQRFNKHRDMLMKDIHDGIGGITANISILAELGKRARTNEEMHDILDKISSLAREGISETRGLMETMERKDVNWGELFAEIRRYGSNMLAPHDIKFQVFVVGCSSEKKIESYFYMTILRIFKESIANIIKHSAARIVTTDVEVEDDKLSVIIKDDGIGMGLSEKKGRGIRNIIARVQELGGSVAFENHGGTAVIVKIPL